MIKVQGKIPNKVYLACSGGVDSMACLDFLSRKHDVTLIFLHHGTENSEKAFRFLTNYCYRNQYVLISKKIKTPEKPEGLSKEEWWRNERYEFFSGFPHGPVITCHHLDDCVETWVWSSLHGEGKIIPYRRGNVIRPFRLTKKEELRNWAEKHGVEWVEDDSNLDTSYTRNYIRHVMMPHVKQVNPGICKVVRKKISNEEREINEDRS